MKAKILLLAIALLTLGAATSQAQIPVPCIDFATVSTASGDSTIVTCEGDGLEETYDFRTSTLAMPFAYLITDENNIILRVSLDNTLSFEGLGEGNFRVWAFSWLGVITAEPGQNAETAQLSDYCGELTTNFIPVINFLPDGGTVSSAAGDTELFVCPDDGVSDVIDFATTGDESVNYTYIVTDENNIIIEVLDGNSFDFDQLDEGTYRVWGVSHAGAFLGQPGDDAAATQLAEDCFGLSDDFVVINRGQPDGGTVALEDGSTEATVCVNDGQSDELTFTNQSTAAASYAYIVTDENNVVLDLVSGDSFDFDSAPPGICRVWGISYTGQLTVQPGDDAAAVALSDGCFDLSDNFIEVTREEADGGTVSFEDGSTETFACVGDGVADEFSFVNTSTGADNYTYLITDENNVILDFAPDGSFDFEGADVGVCRVWGLAYGGNLLAMVGDDAAAVALSDGCFGLSENFLTVRRESVEGGTVANTTGEDPVFTCPGDGNPDLLNLENTGSSTGTYVYVITTEDLIITAVETGDSFDFDGLDEGIYYAWGLAYTGDLTAQIGDDASAVMLSDECFDLSDNFVTVVVETPEGGEVAMPNGETTVNTCPGDGMADIVMFDSSGTSAGAYLYVITDENNVILDIADGDSYDFDAAPAGTCRVWGLAYTGSITAQVGDDAAAVALSDDCFDLSDNFITVIREVPEGGEVAMPNGETTVYTCPGDGMADIVMFDSSGTSATPYIYVITDDNNIILDIADGDSYDFEGGEEGTCRVWGLAYTGNITAQIGDDAAAVALTDDCFDLSDNFITVIREVPEGGSLTFEDGSDFVYICPSDGQPNVLSFDSSGVVGLNFTYVITDQQNIILDVPAGDSYDFEADVQDIVRVWGLAYSGNLTAAVGDTASTIALSDDCFDLSDNFLTVVREQPFGGSVETEAGETLVYTCPGDGNPDIIAFDSTFVGVTPFNYVITDEDNVILEILSGDTFDFDAAPAGTCRVWGLSYTGNLTAMVGDTASAVALSDECFDLSDEFVTIVREVPEGGTVATPDGETTVYTCPGDGNADIVMADSSGTSSGFYTYVITDENNNILELPVGDSFDFENAPDGVRRVWGLAYTGEITAQVGDNAAAVALSDDCFDLSDNFITIVREQPEGGTVSTPDGDDMLLLCPGDGNADVVEFDSTGTAGDYVYVITNEQNVILALVDGDAQDFDGAGIGTFRVWGLAYTGNIIAMAGDTASAVSLSDDCFDLSDNFVTITTQVPNGGLVVTEDGNSTVYTCPGDGVADLISADSVGAVGSYTYVITDEDNVILELPMGDTFDFDGAPTGVCRIWGLAYSGNITAAVGDTASAVMLSDDCFSLSSTFITVVREQPEGGSVSTADGETDLLLCPSGNLDNVLAFDSSGTAGQYTYVLTDEDNVIVDLVTGDSYDFSGQMPGVFRVWGLAYTGNITAQIGDDAAAVDLTDDCYDLSDNFVTVTIEEPDAGTISTDQGDTLEICAGDGIADTVLFEVTNATSNDYLYVVTNADGFIVSAIEEDEFDFENIAPDSYRVYGLSYTGNQNIIPGADIADGELSTDCWDLTDNFIAVNAVDIDAGVIYTEAGIGVDELNLCTTDTSSNIVTFFTTGTTTANDTIVITNESGLVLSILPDNQINLDVAGSGVFLFRSVTFTGDFLLTIGSNIEDAVISDGCFDLSDNTVRVVRDLPEGGDIATADGATEVELCVSPGNGTLDFTTTSDAITPYIYLLTDVNNVVLDISTTATFDFEPLSPGDYRVWGLAYTGVLADIIGEDAATFELASSCYELSSNFVSVNRAATVDGGMIEEVSGLDTIYTCASDMLADVIVLSNNSTAGEYRYIIADENNQVEVADVEGNVIDFNGAPAGTYRVWGVSFVGELELGFNDLIPVDPASDSCFQYSANFITVVHGEPEGGSVFTSDGADAETVTVGDGEADELTFIEVGGNDGLPYAYVVTDTQNVILELLSGDTKDFEMTEPGVCRVWGLSYTGGLLAEVGDTASLATLTDACWDLSNNFVTVTRVEDGNLISGGGLEDRGATATAETDGSAVHIQSIQLAPNPVREILTVDFTLGENAKAHSQLRVLNSQGQVMREWRVGTQAGTNRHQFDVTGWTAGMYVVYLNNGKEVKAVRFLVIK
ncbi:MAG: T9SS type A sorting domain-containing protein [Bacteroidetes bacterium]|jgi:ribose 5-phosphate isomerase|nr:T9SS type A sorting domain-containing protein [Bacteroidota bacterium]